MASFTIAPLTDHTGAEVVGLDFARPIDSDTRGILSRAFIDHHVLVMRDQHFSPAQFKVAAQVFGELQQRVLWDDRSVMHLANADYDMNERRYLYRLMLKGEVPA